MDCCWISRILFLRSHGSLDCFSTTTLSMIFLVLGLWTITFGGASTTTVYGTGATKAGAG